ncbi:MAG: hypothetical protein AAF560_20830 [Acidobacteriota bacterium]
MYFSSVWNAFASRLRARVFLVALPILGLLVTSGCASVTVVAAGDRFLTPDERLQPCGGAMFRLTVSQNLQGQPPISVSVVGTAAGGQVRFVDSRLADITLNNIVSAKLEVLSVPQPRQRNCPFKPGDSCTVDPKVLDRVDDIGGNPAYALVVDECK